MSNNTTGDSRMIERLPRTGVTTPEKMITCFMDESNYLTKIDVVGMPISILQRYIGEKFGLMMCHRTSSISTFTPIEFIRIDNVEDAYKNLTQDFDQCDDIGFQLDKNVRSLNLDTYSLLHHFQEELAQKTRQQARLYEELRDTRIHGDDMECAARESDISMKKRDIERISVLIRTKVNPLIQHLKIREWDNECPRCSTYVSDTYVQTAYRLVCNECLEQINS